MQRLSNIPLTGISAALLTPIFLGLAPIFGKLANNAGADPFTVAAIRTQVAVGLLWLFYLLFFRRYIYIYPAGLIGCIVIGTINGIGSLFFYSGLNLLDASLTQLVNGMYLIVALLLTRIGGEKITLQVWIRVLLALLALVVITGFGGGDVNWLGVGFMLANALMFAGTVIFSQYVLFEMPAPTATLYILTTMGVIVTMAWLPGGEPIPVAQFTQIMTPIFFLGLTTALARLMLFSGVKLMGSLQTAITALAEIGVTLLLARVILGETLTFMQWMGVILLGGTLLLIKQDDLTSRGFNPNALLIENMASLQFQKIVFYQAFGDPATKNPHSAFDPITTQEIHMIREMMGVKNEPVDPFPIVKMQRGLEERNGGFTVDLQAFLENYEDDES